MLVSLFWWQFLDVNDRIMVRSFACCCPTLMLKDRGCWWQNGQTVTNISKLSPTHFVSNFHHQHRCSPMQWWTIYCTWAENGPIFKNLMELKPRKSLNKARIEQFYWTFQRNYLPDTCATYFRRHQWTHLANRPLSKQKDELYEAWVRKQQLYLFCIIKWK